MVGRDRSRLADCRRAPQRIAARRCGARRHVVPDRPRGDRQGARLRPRRPRTRSTRVSDRDFALEFLAARGRSPALHLSRLPRNSCCGRAPVRLRAAVRRVHHRQLDHAAEAQPRRGRAGARQDRPRRPARCVGLLMVMKGLPLTYREGHAGGQGAGLRGGRRADAGSRRDGRHGARHDRARGCAARGRRRAASPPRPISPTGWCASSACRSARRTTSPDAIVKLAEDKRRRASRRCRWPTCSASSQRSPRPCSACWRRHSVASRTSFGGTAPANVREAPRRPRRFCDADDRPSRLFRSPCEGARSDASGGAAHWRCAFACMLALLPRRMRREGRRRNRRTGCRSEVPAALPDTVRR